MKNIFKRLFSLSMAAVLSCSLAGCAAEVSKKPEPPAEEGLLKELDEVPVYTDSGERMMISFMNEMRPKYEDRDEAWQILKESGINTFHSWGHAEWYVEYCEKYGIDYMPFIYGKTPQEYDVKIMPEDLSDSYVGFSYHDEPKYNELDMFSDLAANHQQYFPDEYFYVNLFPYYEGADTAYLSGHTYAEYISKFCEVVYGEIEANRFLSVDIYPLSTAGIHPYFLYTYENIAEYAKAYDATFHFYLCATEHWGYRALNEENLRYMINVPMTYGATAMSYFTYVTYGSGGIFGPGIVSEDGLTKNPQYDVVKQINSEYLNWDHVFKNFKWQETMCLEGTNGGQNPVYTPLEFNVDTIDIIKSVVASEDTLIGRFTGKTSDEIGLMITNFTDPAENKTDTVELELLEANKAIVYVRGVPQVVDVVDGKLTLEILAGDAAFVIPVEIKE